MSSINSLSEYYNTCKALLNSHTDDEKLFQAIVDAPFHNKLHSTSFDLGIVVLLLVNKKLKTVDRMTFSDTDAASWALKMTPIPFKEIRIPLSNKQNILSKAVVTGELQKTSDWQYLFTPILEPESARFNQAGAGIACSYASPMPKARDGGVLIFSYYQPFDNVKSNHLEFMKKYTQIAEEALTK